MAMRPLTTEEVNKIGELVKQQFPSEIEVEWYHDVGKGEQYINFTLRQKK
jgi:hypothetical protein